MFFFSLQIMKQARERRKSSACLHGSYFSFQWNAGQFLSSQTIIQKKQENSYQKATQ